MFEDLSYKNGLDTLIESAHRVAQEYPDILFVVAGKGPSRKLIEDSIKELGIENNIKLTGFVPDELLPVYYNAADTLFFPPLQARDYPWFFLKPWHADYRSSQQQLEEPQK